MNESSRLPAARAVGAAGTTAVGVLAAISFCHLLNDMMQSLLPALYPMLRGSYRLSFTQIGLLTFTFQFTASLLQPLVGLFADRSPRPYSLAAGMGFTLAGLLLLAFADSYALLLIAAALIGTGSSVFHPESSRVARMASGGKHGLAQSVFQVGGNLGTSAGPLLAAFVVLPHGQSSVAWFSLAALLGIVLLINVGHWYKTHGVTRLRTRRDHRHRAHREVTSSSPSRCCWRWCSRSMSTSRASRATTPSTSSTTFTCRCGMLNYSCSYSWRRPRPAA